MNRFALAVLLSLAAAAFPPGVSAQNVFRCGDRYSQSPCPGGTAIDTTDSRSPAQKAQTDAATARDARAAAALEKARLKQEALARTTPASTEKPAAGEVPATTSKPSAKKKTRKPEYFTAKDAAAPKKKKKEKSVQVGSTSSETDPSGKK